MTIFRTRPREIPARLVTHPGAGRVQDILLVTALVVGAASSGLIGVPTVYAMTDQDSAGKQFVMLLFLPITYDQPDLVVALYYDAPSDSLRSCGGRRVTRTRRPMSHLK